MEPCELRDRARQIQLDGLEMAKTSGRGGAHLGGSFSAVEILTVLYEHVMRLDVENPTWDERDRFLASKNHCVLAHLPVLARRGFFPVSELQEFQKDGGRLTGYPLRPEIGLEYSGGSLGMAISVGVGQALALREKYGSGIPEENENSVGNLVPRVFVLMGDAELNEGSIWEAFMSASHYKLDNLVAVIDRNHLSYDGDTEEIMAIEPLEEKLRAFGMDVVSCDGHDVDDLIRAFDETLTSSGKPHVVIADTVKGKGVSFMEGVPSYHHASITEEQYIQAKEEILG